MSKPLVLFVDDDTNLLRSWARSFSQEPYTMVFASSGAEALTILKGLKAAVIVTDFAMANGNGIQLLEKVHTLYPDTTRILVSGHATLSVAQEAINKCGVHKLFEKPCNIVELGVSIREGLKPVEESTLPVGNQNIAALERSFPGISKVKRSGSGAIEI